MFTEFGQGNENAVFFLHFFSIRKVCPESLRPAFTPAFCIMFNLSTTTNVQVLCSIDHTSNVIRQPKEYYVNDSSWSG